MSSDSWSATRLRISPWLRALALELALVYFLLMIMRITRLLLARVIPIGPKMPMETQSHTKLLVPLQFACDDQTGLSPRMHAKAKFML